MTLLFALFFGAGVAGWTYSKMDRRLGSGNGSGAVMTAGIVFLMGTIIFFTVLKTVGL